VEPPELAHDDGGQHEGREGDERGIPPTLSAPRDERDARRDERQEQPRVVVVERVEVEPLPVEEAVAHR
jgi:hypothetical protein